MGSKCTRCNRQLKNPQYIAGEPFGPVCFLKMGGTPADHATKENTRQVFDPDQLSFFDDPTTSGER